MLIRLACAVLCLSPSACCCGIPLSTASLATYPATPATTPRQEIERPYLEIPGKPDKLVPMTTDQKAHDELSKYSHAGDLVGIERMIGQGRAFNVAPRTRVVILDRGFLTTEVRIMNGIRKNQTGIVSSDWIVK